MIDGMPLPGFAFLMGAEDGAGFGVHILRTSLEILIIECPDVYNLNKRAY